ncbi:hypothetical protein GCM10009677_47610 [Sphaerisporangium rubeum]
MCQRGSISRTFWTSWIQRDVIQAHGHSGSNQKSTGVLSVMALMLPAGSVAAAIRDTTPNPPRTPFYSSLKEYEIRISRWDPRGETRAPSRRPTWQDSCIPSARRREVRQDEEWMWQVI